jgi:hypothetical protein
VISRSGFDYPRFEVLRNFLFLSLFSIVATSFWIISYVLSSASHRFITTPTSPNHPKPIVPSFFANIPPPVVVGSFAFALNAGDSFRMWLNEYHFKSKPAGFTPDCKTTRSTQLWNYIFQPWFRSFSWMACNTRRYQLC